LTEERRIEKVPWVPIILLSVLTSFFGSVISLLAKQCGYNSWSIIMGTKFTILPFVFLVAAYPFRKLLKISSSNLTYLYAALTIICYNNFGNTFGDPSIGMSRTVLFTTGAVRDMMGSWWWVPSPDVVSAMMMGGVAVNWAAWAGAIVFWSTFSYSLFLFNSGLSLVFRKRWIDIERIPFPLTMSAHEVISSVDVNRPSDWSQRPIFIGFLLGLIFEMPVFLQAILPWFPDIYGWRANTCPSATQQFPADNSLAQNIVGLAMMSKDPVAFGLCFLAPLSVSFNVWFWSLVMFGLEQVSYQMGYYTGIFQEGACCRVLSHTGVSLAESPPFSWGYVSGVGGATAIAAMLLYSSRGYLRQTFKLATGQHSSPSEEERGEVASYRTAYMVLAAGTIAVILWLMSAGIELGSALAILIFSIFVSGIAGFYTYSHTGFYALNNLRGGHSWFPVQARWGGSLPALNPGMIMSNWTTQEFSNGNFLMVFPSAQMMPLKMASLTGTSNRNTFLVTAVAMLISTPLISITGIWIANTYGATVITWGACSIEKSCSGWDWAPPLAPLVSYGTIGFIITFTLAMLHSRFVWFPFEPLGFVIATSVPGLWYGVWSSFLVAWVVKMIVLRVGGSRLYERYGVPAVGGLLSGVALSIFIGSIIIALRFYFPF
jgi:hypothetical protein